MAVPNMSDFYNYLNQVNLRLNKAMNTYIRENRDKLERLKNHYILKNPISIYEIKEQRFDTTFEKLQLVMAAILKNEINRYEKHIEKINVLTINQLEKNKNNYINLLNKLEILNPLLTIKRGYSITKKDDKVITSVKKLKKDDDLVVELTDGYISTKVLDIKES